MRSQQLWFLGVNSTLSCNNKNHTAMTVIKKFRIKWSNSRRYWKIMARNLNAITVFQQNMLYYSFLRYILYFWLYSSMFELSVHLVAEKTNVCPLKTIGIPRLRLCIASLLIRLLNTVKPTLDLGNVTQGIKNRDWSKVCGTGPNKVPGPPYLLILI